MPLSDLMRFAVAGRVAVEASPLGGPVVRLIDGDRQALVALHGGQVLNWTVGGEGLLWLSPTARMRAGKGLRGGIPVCWPWFGDHAHDPTKPAHGFVRQRNWRLASTAAVGGRVSAVLETETSPADHPMWPHSARVKLTVALGDALSLALTTTNTGADAFPLTQALHTYFRVTDIGAVEVLGLDRCAYRDKLESFARKVQAGPVTFSGEVDRIYVGETSALTLVDQIRKRRIAIASAGSRSAVVWNPWIDKTTRLGDMGSPDAYRQMVCIETANAGDDNLVLGAGEMRTLTATYRVM